MPGCPLRKTCARPSDGAGQDQKPEPEPKPESFASKLARTNASRINALLHLKYRPHRFNAALALFFDLDLKRPVKPRRPNFDVELQGKPAGRRFSRTGPGMALCGGPPNQCRSSGIPARAFCLLLGCSKVRRRKGATKSRRYRSNGYVHISLVGVSQAGNHPSKNRTYVQCPRRIRV